MFRRAMSRVTAGLTVAIAPLLMGSANMTFDQQVLAAHNRERSILDIPPLEWDSSLVASAQAWADHLAATGAFEHAPERETDPQGENIWAGSRGYYSARAMVNAWIREKRNFRTGVFPQNSATGDVSDVGHYTQLMWRDTHQVGCAFATGRVEDILVCRYAQAGNYLGEKPF